MTPNTAPKASSAARDSALEDLAFMRALVAPDDRWQRQFGRIYGLAGICYSVQTVLHMGQFAGLVPSAGWPAPVVGWGPTIVFVLFLIWNLSRDRSPPSGASRAIGSVFGAVGLANIALAISIASISFELRNSAIWLIYPVVVMVLQGMAWLVAFMLRRRGWLAVVATGWFGVGIAMAISITNLLGFVIAAFVGCFFFMLLPGLYIMRQGAEGV
jgi:hypothetical protein